MGDRARDKMMAAMHARKARQEAQRIADMVKPIPEDNKGRCRSKYTEINRNNRPATQISAGNSARFSPFF